MSSSNSFLLLCLVSVLFLHYNFPPSSAQASVIDVLGVRKCLHNLLALTNSTCHMLFLEISKLQHPQKFFPPQKVFHGCEGFERRQLISTFFPCAWKAACNRKVVVPKYNLDAVDLRVMCGELRSETFLKEILEFVCFIYKLFYTESRFKKNHKQTCYRHTSIWKISTIYRQRSKFPLTLCELRQEVL